MIGILGRHGSDDGYLMGNLRAVGHQFAKMDTGYARLDTPERAGKFTVWQRMPTLVLTDSSIQPDEADLFFSFLDLLGNGRMEEAAKPRHSTQRAKHATPGHGMDCLSAGEAFFR
jgi:hypothetical protein